MKGQKPATYCRRIGDWQWWNLSQEFDPDRWEKPQDAVAAFADSVEVVVEENSGDAVSRREYPMRAETPLASLRIADVNGQPTHLVLSLDESDAKHSLKPH